MNEIVTAGFDYSSFSQRFVRAAKVRAKKIRDHDRVAGDSVIAMSGELKDQRDAFGSYAEKSGMRGRDTWGAWLQAELGMDRGHANRIIQMGEKVRGGAAASRLGHDIVKILSAKNTPQQLVDEVLKLAEEGKLPKNIKARIEVVRKKKKKLVSGDTRPTPKEAKQQAKASGAVVLASDDRYYTPMDEKDLEDYNERRDRTFTVMEAIEIIAKISLDPGKWLDDAEKRWLSGLNLADIEFAGTWLGQLAKDYKVRKKIIDNIEADHGNQESKASSHPSS